MESKFAVADDSASLWSCHFDAAEDAWYWYNEETGVSRWAEEDVAGNDSTIDSVCDEESRDASRVQG